MAIAGQVVFRLDNIRGLEEKLRQMKRRQRAKVSAVVEATAGRVKNRAFNNALPHWDRGDLGRAIVMAGRGLRWRVGLRDGAIPSRGGHNAAHLNPWVYVIFLEYGTNNPFRPAHPFMKPAANAEFPVFELEIERALEEALRP